MSAYIGAVTPTPQVDGYTKAQIDGLLEAIRNESNHNRFDVFLWTGKNCPLGSIESSGQETLDLMFPTMRSDVVASQFYCTEAEWQADPYKRVTHWSLGNGTTTTGSWMRPPDKNGVQSGNVGTFYGAGSNPLGTKTGTAVIDAMRNIVGEQSLYVPQMGKSTGPFSNAGANANNGVTVAGAPINDAAATGNGAGEKLFFDASLALPAGTTTDPVTGEFRPKTWYGIWCIRMYGRVTRMGDLNAAAFDARLNMIDARTTALEGRVTVLEAGNTARKWQQVTRTQNVIYTNSTGNNIVLNVQTAAGTNTSRSVVVDIMNSGESTWNTVSVAYESSPVTAMAVGNITIPPGAQYRITSASISTCYELR